MRSVTTFMKVLHYLPENFSFPKVSTWEKKKKINFSLVLKCRNCLSIVTFSLSFLLEESLVNKSRHYWNQLCRAIFSSLSSLNFFPSVALLWHSNLINTWWATPLKKKHLIASDVLYHLESIKSHSIYYKVLYWQLFPNSTNLNKLHAVSTRLFSPLFLSNQ